MKRLRPIDQVISEEPGQAKAFQIKAFTLQGRGLFREAILAFDRALELEPGNSVSLFMRAFNHLQLGNWGRVVLGCGSGLIFGDEGQRGALLMFRAEAFIALRRTSEAKADLLQIDGDCQLWTDPLRAKNDLLKLCD